jgi:hypothetical protein
MKNKEQKMLSIKEVAQRTGASPSSIRVWLSNPEEREKRFPGAELVRPPVGVPYWLIPEETLEAFQLSKPGPKPGSKRKRKPL